MLGTIDNVDWSIDGAVEEFEKVVNDDMVEHREPYCVPISIMESKDGGNFFSMHLAPDPTDEDFNKILKKYSPVLEKRPVLDEVQNVPECLIPSRHGKQVIVRDKIFHQDAGDAGFRRAVACVS